jgi:hypothetical protein
MASFKKISFNEAGLKRQLGNFPMTATISSCSGIEGDLKLSQP